MRTDEKRCEMSTVTDPVRPIVRAARLYCSLLSVGRCCASPVPFIYILHVGRPEGKRSSSPLIKRATAPRQVYCAIAAVAAPT